MKGVAKVGGTEEKEAFSFALNFDHAQGFSLPKPQDFSYIYVLVVQLKCYTFLIFLDLDA